MRRATSRACSARARSPLYGGAWAENVIVQLQKAGFPGPIWPIHPTRAEIRGIPCHRDLPGVPDAAFVGVNRTLTVEVVRELAEAGAGGAICFAAGFREAGDAALEDALVAAAGAMPLLGPNCYGFVNYLDAVPLWPDQHGGTPGRDRRRHRHPVLEPRDQPLDAAPRRCRSPT